MSKELLQQGIAALKAGRKDEARRLLERVVQENPRSEQGWLWLSGAVDTDEERRFCLAQILSINPRNALAQRGLEALGPGPVLSPARPGPRRRVEGPVLSPAHPEPRRGVEEPVRSLLADLEEPLEQPVEKPPVTPAADITCPRCDTLNPPDFRFCDRCGASLVPPDLDDTQPIPVVKPPPVAKADPLPAWLQPSRPPSAVVKPPSVEKAAPLAPKPIGQTPPVEDRPQQIGTRSAQKRSPSLVAIIVAGLGCLLVVGGGLGLMEGDPSALICWVPGIILTIAGFVLNASSKKKQTGSKGVPSPIIPESPKPAPPVERQPEHREETHITKEREKSSERRNSRVSWPVVLLVLACLAGALWLAPQLIAGIGSQSSPTAVVKAFLDRMCRYDYDGANALIAPDHRQRVEWLADLAGTIREREFCSIDDAFARQQTGLLANPRTYNVTVITTRGDRAVFYTEQLEGRWYMTSSWNYFVDW
jgi:hypothetical protein